jgi:hypothetical protein
MKTSETTDIALPLSPQVSQGDGDHAVMPGEFAGMYQAGFEAGYDPGREAISAGFGREHSRGPTGPKRGCNKNSCGQTSP